MSTTSPSAACQNMPIPLLVALAAGGAALYKYYSPPSALRDDRSEEEKQQCAAAFYALKSREKEGAIHVGESNWMLVSSSHGKESGRAGFVGDATVLRWVVRIEQTGRRIELVHGEISGKKRIYVNNVLVHESMTFIDEGIVHTLPAHLFEPLCVCVVIDIDQMSDWLYDLKVNDKLLADIEQRRQANLDGGFELSDMSGSTACSSSQTTAD